MNSNIFEITEKLKQELPSPDENTISFIEKWFPYNGITFAITFWKVQREDKSFFWLCNPFYTTQVLNSLYPN